MTRKWNEASFIVGLDLGQSQDFTGIAVLESQTYVSPLLRDRYPFPAVKVGWNSPASLPQEVRDAAYGNLRGVPSYVNTLGLPWPGKPLLALRHIERFRGVPYPQVVQRVQELVAQEPIARMGAIIALDGTGVGRGITDMFRQTDLEIRAITIHGGDSLSRAGGYVRVPKRDLVGATQAALQSKRLQVAEGLDLWPVLRDELQNFRVRIDPKTSHDSYSSWREAQHDDLVLALAMAIWCRDWLWRSRDVSRMNARERSAA